MFDASAATIVKIEFDQYYRQYSGDRGYVQVWDGAAWNTVVTYSSTQGGWGAPNHPCLDITAYKKQKRKELEALLTAQAQDCARIANGDLAVYLSSGYEAKDIKGSPKGALRQVTGVSLSFGNNDGELKIGWDTMREALIFTVQVYSDISNPDGSILKEFFIGKIGRSKAVLNELPSGSKVFARVRANGGRTGHGDWSDPAEKRVP